jgi:hypothetical protein
MARPRKVKPEESLKQLDGAAKPQGTHLARRARAALRADESVRLSVEETRERMAFSSEQLRILDCIAAGLPVRAAREAIAALRLKADYLLQKPAVDHRVGVIQIISPYGEDPQGPPALPAVGDVVVALPEEDGEEP